MPTCAKGRWRWQNNRPRRNAVKITRIETQRISIPFENDGPRVGLRPSLDSKPWTNMECLLVRVETDDGLVGWGEGFGHFVHGGTEVMLDVNCPWSVSEAKAVARAIRDRNFHWLEEPVWPPEDYAGLAEVRKEGVAIACGENVTSLHEFRRLFEQQAVDVVQPSVIKLG